MSQRPRGELPPQEPSPVARQEANELKTAEFFFGLAEQVGDRLMKFAETLPLKQSDQLRLHQVIGEARNTIFHDSCAHFSVSLSAIDETLHHWSEDADPEAT